jgi:hypothetical protein
VVSPLDAEPAEDKATWWRAGARARAKARSGQGAERVAEGGNLNQLNNQTAVHEREPYMLYRETRNKTMKRETTEVGRQEERETVRRLSRRCLAHGFRMFGLQLQLRFTVASQFPICFLILRLVSSVVLSYPAATWFHFICFVYVCASYNV